MAKKSRARSPELTGGEGFTYEDGVAVIYLSALLRQEAAPSTRGTVVRVAVQQKRQGDPLDDLIVDSEDVTGRSRLSLQVKRHVVVSSSNEDVQEIIREAVLTRAKGDFRVGRDRYGFATRSIAISGFDDLNRIIGFATASTNGQEFGRRFVQGGEANARMIEMRSDLRSLIDPVDDDAEWDFYRHLVALRLDNLGEGEDRFVDLSNRLSAVAESTGSNIVDVFSHEVRKGEGKAKVWTRNSLIADVRAKVRLRAAPSYEHDVKALTELAKAYVQEIRADIEGVSLDRAALVDVAEEVARSKIYSNINGAPGCGKSVVLRRCVERALARGPVLFLKSDRLEGTGWRSFAQRQGLQHLEAVALLGEIGGAGTPTLFIDGIDRIKAEHRGIVTDLLTALQSSPHLAHWHVLVTSRDQGLEPLRSWIPASFYASTGIGDVVVSALNDDEAEELAKKRPELRPLLFGPDAVQEIARRPFFAAVLADQAARLGFSDSPPPQTETELIDAWWRAGGYNVEETAADQRQHALLNLAEVGAPTLGKGIVGRQLAPETRGQLEGLRRDKLIDVVVAGSRYQFSHDIFFEWAFFRLLIDQGVDWPAALVAAGEPPLLSRIVGLLSQHAYEQAQDWQGTYRDIEARPLRPQWRRSWLLGPASSTRFAERISDFQSLSNENDFELLEKFLVWFQAERTIPSPVILKIPLPGLENAEIVRAADLMGWPSDIAEWQRVLTWIFEIHPTLPSRLLPAVVELFGVWQNMFADIRNRMSQRIVELSATWLLDIECRSAERWKGLRDDARSSAADTLRKLILRAARSYPAQAEGLLDGVIADDKRPNGVVKAIYGLSAVLAQVFPEKLAALLKAEVFDELPKDERDRKERERRDRYERIDAIRAKPESERTKAEKRALSSPPVFYSMGRERYDFNDIGIGREHGFFHPAAAGHEPFDSLFQFAPDVARELVRDVANHATTGWRQIFELHRSELGTPLPIVVDFPWGRQEFWGDARSYSWFCGAGCPQPLAAAFLSLTLWAHKRREAGDDLEMLLRQVVEGHTSVAALGLAISLAIEANERAPSLLALLKTQRLWHLDFQRQVQESTRGISLMGISPTHGMNAKHREAHEYLMGRSYRGRSLKDMSYLYALAPEEAVRIDFVEALKRFPADLPFDLEEHRGDEGAQQYLLERAEAWSRFGDKEHYGVRRSNENPKMIEVVYQDPIPPTEDVKQRLVESGIYLREVDVATRVIKSLKAGRRDDQLNVAATVDFAKSRDSASLFDSLAEAGSMMTQSCLAAAACLVVRFGGAAEETEWAWSVLDRIAAMDAGPNENPHSEYNLDPRVFLMVALKFDVASGAPKPMSVRRLIDLTIARNSYIAQGALAALLDSSAVPLEITWNAGSLASDLFCFPADEIENYEDNYSRMRLHASESLARAIDRLEAGTQAEAQLSPPPPAWEKVKGKPRRRGEVSPDGEILAYPSIEFDAKFAAKVAPNFPVKAWLASTIHHDQLIAYVTALVFWTSERLYPPFASKDSGDSTDLYEWTDALARLVSRVILELPLDQAMSSLVEPIAGRGGGRRYRQYLSTLTDAVTRRHVFDAPTIPVGTLELLDALMTQMLAESDFLPKSYRAGEINNHEIREMIRSFLLTSATGFPGAARFANGDWTGLPPLLPQIERLITTVGWADAVMDEFLILVSRSAAEFPISTFSRIVLGVLDSGHVRLERWNATGLPARLSGAIQALADTRQPLTAGDARGLLLILDRLVDMGDRRAAALQQSEHFRGIQVGAAERQA